MVSGCAGSSSSDPSGLRATFAQRDLEQNPSVTLEAHARGGEFFRCSGPRRNLQVAFSSPTIETTQTAAKLLPEVLFFFFLKGFIVSVAAPRTMTSLIFLPTITFKKRLRPVGTPWIQPGPEAETGRTWMFASLHFTVCLHVLCHSV